MAFKGFAEEAETAKETEKVILKVGRKKQERIPPW